MSFLRAPIAGQTFLPCPTTASNGTATPPTARGIDLNDALAWREINVADYFDPNSGNDVLLQEVLDYAGALAMAFKNSSFDDIHQRMRVRVTYPRGLCTVQNQVVVPEMVDLNCIGTIIRGNTGNLSNLYLPAIVFVPHSHCAALDLDCNPDGTNLGSGVVFGKTWSMGSVALSSAGTGYSVGDVITLANVSRNPYYGAQVTVASIGTGGTIATFTLTSGGQYSVRPALQPTTFAQASTTGTGTGAVFTPAWASDWAPANGYTDYAYQAGELLVVNWLVGNVTVTGIGIGNDPLYGPMFGVMMNMQNADIGSIQTVGGYKGIIHRGADIRAGSLNSVGADFGLVSAGCSCLTCDNVVMDSSKQAFIQVYHTQGLRLSGRMFWQDSNDIYGSPCNSGYAIIVGQNDTALTDDLYLDFSLENAGKVGGATALYLDYAQNAKITLKAGNAGYTKTLSSFATFGTHNSASVMLEGSIDGITGSLFTGAAPGAVRVFDVAADGMAGPMGTYDLVIPTTPTATTGQNKAGPGSVCRVTGSGLLYTNTGSAATPNWVVAGSGKPSVLAVRTGRFYTTDGAFMGTAGGFSSSASNVALTAVPVFIPNAMPPVYLAFEITTASTAAFNAYMGIYSDLSGQPASLLMSTGLVSVPANATGAQVAAVVSPTLLQPGWYWLVLESSYVTPVATFRAIQNGGQAMSYLGFALTTGAASNPVSGVSWGGQTFGPLPTTFSAQYQGYNAGFGTPAVWVGF